MQSDIYARHGEIYLQAGLVEKAEELLGRAVELQPRRDDHVAARARVRLQAARAVVTDRARLRRLQGAIDDLERAVRSSPLMAEHHAAQGRAHETWAALTDRPRKPFGTAASRWKPTTGRWRCGRTRGRWRRPGAASPAPFAECCWPWTSGSGRGVVLPEMPTVRWALVTGYCK